MYTLYTAPWLAPLHSDNYVKMAYLSYNHFLFIGSFLLANPGTCMCTCTCTCMCTCMYILCTCVYMYVHMRSVYVVSVLWRCLQFDRVSASPELLEKCQIYKTNWFHISPHKPQKTVGSHSSLGLCGLGRGSVH